MKYIILIPILIYSMIAQADKVPMLSNLDSLEWENRIVIIKDMKNADDALQLLKQQVAEIDDRDIIWFIIKDDLALTNYPGQLSSDFVRNTLARLGTGRGKVILIGKDGGIKSRSEYLDLRSIYSQIDAMPMRRFEMRNN